VNHSLAGLALHCLHDSWVELAPGVRAASGGRGQDADGESPSAPRAFGSLEWPGTNPAAGCALREAADAVQAMLGCLTVEQRFVVEQVCFEHRSAAQISELTRWTRAAVWKRYERARRKLVARFAEAAAALLRD
jgi:DNA-directed RNA polymerase specialized sigma24 family protein